MENEWARSCVGIPAVRGSATAATVRRMEELGVLLAGPTDHLLLDRPLDGDYRSYAERTGLDAPAELITDVPAAGGGTSRAVLDSPTLLERLRGLADADAYLMPMGNSVQEKLIGKLTGLRSAVPDATTYERVNSKLYNRRVAEELGLRTMAGHWCETVRQLRHALAAGLRDGGPVIVEDAYGVSGKGLVVLDSRKKGDRLLLVIDRRAATSGEQALHAVVEAFLPKRFDLNDQFTIAATGGSGWTSSRR